MLILTIIILLWYDFKDSIYLLKYVVIFEGWLDFEKQGDFEDSFTCKCTYVWCVHKNKPHVLSAQVTSCIVLIRNIFIQFTQTLCLHYVCGADGVLTHLPLYKINGSVINFALQIIQFLVHLVYKGKLPSRRPRKWVKVLHSWKLTSSSHTHNMYMTHVHTKYLLSLVLKVKYIYTWLCLLQLFLKGWRLFLHCSSVRNGFMD